MGETLDVWRDPLFDDRHRDVPADLARRLEQMADEVRGRHIFYERMHALLAAAFTRELDAAAFDLEAPPSPAEKEVGMSIGQAFHQGCSLDDVALACGLTPERVIAIGKRTIKRTKWLDRL